MSLINIFHKMESKSSLFDIGKKEGLPLWDIVRYHVYIKYYYPEESRIQLNITKRRVFSEYLNLLKQLFIFLFRLLFYKCTKVFLISSRYVNNNSRYYDKSALPIINIDIEKSLVIDSILSEKAEVKYIFDFSNVLKKFIRAKKVPFVYYQEIDKIIKASLGVNLMSYSELNHIFNIYRSEYLFYKTIFYFKKPQKFIISTGNPKGSLQAAKESNIKTYLVQHAGIEFDEIDYSYPNNISSNSNILFPDYVLTLGNYWCKNINVPASNIIPIGNDYFYSKPNVLCDDSILIISTIIHGTELSVLTKEMAFSRPDLRFVYKLHSNEFHLYNSYTKFFVRNKNVSIISDQLDTSVLIAKSQLVVLIVSAVIYEALNQNKKVVIYKRINYKRQLVLSDFPNVFFVNVAAEIFELLDKKSITSKVDFYNKTDIELLNSLFKD